MKNVRMLVPIICVLVGLGVGFLGGFEYKNYQTMKRPSNAQPSVSSTLLLNTITMEEVAKHADQNSCWLVIDNNVYDVTSFIPGHPGGLAILAGCGKDATALFNGRPNVGTSHSSRARDMLSGLQIGVLR